ncbi:zinc finger BED domain-containing protein 4-like [Sinocyclocheilus anshuiensis]|uniref:zinc finger BED domain-containing protein 4-like n=1 Tax=Sinocyclocheilus anshuiensis TaxID=1608454 RepID=UPI0007B7BB92|nr:PREDICTED: zinc finger BED domain-containing protein 4-like [Sinocyclocheilus anshuiensis]
MVQSLIEQKRLIGVYVSENELPPTLTANQWNLMEKMVNVLAPYEEMTHQVSSSDALASDVIPAVTVLQRLLLKQMDEDHGIKTMKSTSLDALQRCFSNMEQNTLYCIASLLDTRYKD